MDFFFIFNRRRNCFETQQSIVKLLSEQVLEKLFDELSSSSSKLVLPSQI